MTNSPLVQLVTTPTVTRAGAGPSQCTHQECQAQGLQSLVLLSSLLLICTGTASFTSLFLYLLCRKMKTLKATMLVLLLGLFSFGVYHMGGLGTLTWSTTGELGELSETLSLPVQLRKLQEQLYHLRWSAKDVAELALQEGVKQAKLPGFTGQIRARGRRIYSGVLSSLQHAVQEIINQALEKLEEIQALMPDYALKSAGAMTLCIQTSSKALPVQIDKMGIGTCRGTGEKGREVKGQFVPLAEPVIGQTPWEAQKGCFTVLSFAMAKYDNLMSPRNVFQRGRATKVFLYSLPVMDYMRSPELILEPENHPGNCWPFPGSKDHVFIKLPVPVNPRAITMDHGSGTAFHGESISGPPKDFALYGFKEEHEEQGQFTFLAALNPSQTFQLKEQLKEKQRHCVVTDDFHKRKSADIPEATSALLCPFCSARSFCNMSDALGTDLLDCCYSIPDPQLVWRIMSQLEFYLSGENLAKDAFLLKHVQKNKMGFLSIKLLTSFKKLLEVNEEETIVLRGVPIPESRLSIPPSKLLLAWELLPLEQDALSPLQEDFLETITRMFSPFCAIASIRILRPGRKLPSDARKYTSRFPELLSQCCVPVEYESLGSARRALEELGHPGGRSIQGGPTQRKGSKKKPEAVEELVDQLGWKAQATAATFPYGLGGSLLSSAWELNGASALP
ncbi:hypothetical protein Q9966_013895 [Columba livia]|nr:hypothetical protein Q9966_013895 [Columba livia]